MSLGDFSATGTRITYDGASSGALSLFASLSINEIHNTGHSIQGRFDITASGIPVFVVLANGAVADVRIIQVY